MQANRLPYNPKRQRGDGVRLKPSPR
jgi:hypothetical protein